MRLLFFVTIATAAMFSTSADALESGLNFVMSTCTTACDSINSFAVGTQIGGVMELSSQPGENWGAADIVSFEIAFFNPAAPRVDFVGDNFPTANPLFFGLDRLMVADEPVGPDMLTTSGTTTDSGHIDSGTLLFAMDTTPFANDLWIIINIFSAGSATMEICLFYQAAGCIEGATQVVVAEGCFNNAPEGCGQFSVPLPATSWFFGFSLLTLLRIRKRQTQSRCGSAKISSSP